MSLATSLIEQEWQAGGIQLSVVASWKQHPTRQSLAARSTTDSCHGRFDQAGCRALDCKADFGMLGEVPLSTGITAHSTECEVHPSRICITYLVRPSSARARWPNFPRRTPRMSGQAGLLAVIAGEAIHAGSISTAILAMHLHGLEARATVPPCRVAKSVALPENGRSRVERPPGSQLSTLNSRLSTSSHDLSPCFAC